MNAPNTPINAGFLLHSEMEVLRRVEDQRRVEDCEAERREDLNEEQCGRSLRSRRKRRDFDEAMPIIFARYLASLTAYVASSFISSTLTHSLPFIRLFGLPIYLAQLPSLK